MGILNLPQDPPIVTKVLLNNVSVTGVGPVVKTLTSNKAFHVIITGIATVGIEGSNDNIHFELLFPAVNTSAIIDDLSPSKFYRGRVFSILSGDVSIIMGIGG